MADPLAIRTEIGVGSRLESVVGLGHLLGGLREVSLEGTVGALHARRETHLLARRRRLGSRGHSEEHQYCHDASHSFHRSSPFSNAQMVSTPCRRKLAAFSVLCFVGAPPTRTATEDVPTFPDRRSDGSASLT